MVRYISCIQVQCKCCGSILEGRYTSPADPEGPLDWCQCGKVGLHPGPIMYRIVGNPENVELIRKEISEDGENHSKRCEM